MKYCSAQRSDHLTPLPESFTACAMITDSGDELEISELMMRRACDLIDADQVWPFAGQTVFGGMRTVSNSASADILPFRRPAN